MRKVECVLQGDSNNLAVFALSICGPSQRHVNLAVGPASRSWTTLPDHVVANEKGIFR